MNQFGTTYMNLGSICVANCLSSECKQVGYVIFEIVISIFHGVIDPTTSTAPEQGKIPTEIGFQSLIMHLPLAQKGQITACFTKGRVTFLYTWDLPLSFLMNFRLLINKKYGLLQLYVFLYSGYLCKRRLILSL